MTENRTSCQIVSAGMRTEGAGRLVLENHTLLPSVLGALGAFWSRTSSESPAKSGLSENLMVMKRFSCPALSVARPLTTSQASSALSLEDQGGQTESEATVSEIETTVPRSARKQALEHAASLLARPVCASIPGKPNQQDLHHHQQQRQADEQHIAFTELPLLLLSNLYHSFVTLVESRFRSYFQLLQRTLSAKMKDVEASQESPSGMSSSAKGSRCRVKPQGTVVSQLEESIAALLEMRQGIVVHRISTQFLAASPNEQHAQNEWDDPTHSTCSAFDMQLSMDLSIEEVATTPGISSMAHGDVDRASKKCHLVVIQAPGFITGTWSADSGDLEDVTLHVDTHHLLAALMREASLLVASAVKDAADKICTLHNFEPRPSSSAFLHRDECKLGRRPSQLDMPPPLPKKPKLEPVEGLELLSSTAASSLPIVSPDMGSSTATTLEAIPVLELGNHEADGEADVDEQAISQLTADQCEDIIDGVFGCIDDNMLGHQGSEYVTLDDPSAASA